MRCYHHQPSCHLDIDIGCWRSCYWQRNSHRRRCTGHQSVLQVCFTCLSHKFLASAFRCIFQQLTVKLLLKLPSSSSSSSVLWRCWLGDKKGIRSIVSKTLEIAVNISGWDTVRSTLCKPHLDVYRTREQRVWACFVRMDVHDKDGCRLRIKESTG